MSREPATAQRPVGARRLANYEAAAAGWTTMSEEAPVEIRILERTDVSAVLDIDAQHTGRPRDAILKRRLERAFEPGRMLISFAALIEGQVVGFLLGDVVVGDQGVADRSATIDTFGVRLDVQGHGIARRLLTAYAEHARALGVERLQTQVASSNARLLRFLSRAGFQQAPRVALELELANVPPGQWDDEPEC